MGNNDSKNLLLAIVAGVIAMVLLYSYSQEKRAEFDKEFGAKRRVVRAREDIPELSTIYENMLDTTDLPTSFVPPETISSSEEIIGNVAAIPIKKGQLIFKNSLYSPGADTGIASQVPPDMRALTIPIDETRAVAKLLRPGDRVDILAALDIGKGNSASREVQTIMQNVPVIATGVNVMNNIPRMFESDTTGKIVSQIALTGDTKYSTITIEVNMLQAQDLVYIMATSPGNIFFTLRNPNDRVVKPRLPAATSDSIAGRLARSYDVPGNAPSPLITQPAAPAPAFRPAVPPAMPKGRVNN